MDIVTPLMDVGLLRKSGDERMPKLGLGSRIGPN